MEGESERRSLAVRLVCGLSLGFVLVAIGQAIAVAIAIPLPSSGVAMRVAHLIVGFAETLGVGGLVVVLPVYLWIRYVRLPRWVGFLVMSASASLLLWRITDVETYRQACVTFDNPRLETVAYYVILAGYGTVFPFAMVVGMLVSRFKWFFMPPLVIALGVFVGAQIFTRDDYVSVHGLVTFGLPLVVGTTLAPRAERLYERLRAGRNGRVALYGLAALAVIGVLFPPPDLLRVELFRDTTTFAPWVLAKVWRPPSPPTDPPPPSSPWYATRGEQPDVAPTTPPLVAKNPVVVMVTIDATRGDAVNDPANAKDLPTISGLRENGIAFLNATSPGSQTAVSLTALFSGKTYTMLDWEYYGVGVMRFGYPASDPAVRFPELLTEHGVRTAAVSSINFQGEEYGVVRGFQDHRVVVHGRQHAMARQVIEPALDILRKAGEGPLFLYFHLMEPHAPYDRGKRTGSDYERYLSEIAVADRELARVVRLVDQKFGDRAVFILAADHGEAFGEHQTKEHSKTLYQEMIHIPLIIRTPEKVKRVVEQRVALADLGPTILDIFGLPTPSRFVGQSLVPILEGKSDKLERPILAEGRLRLTLIEPDGMKVIDDPRRKTVEAYDLVADPNELHDVFGSDPRADGALVELRTFFKNNELAAKRPGYSPPFKP
jgi:choline-sulfatase